jgi:hypothetical protein
LIKPASLKRGMKVLYRHCFEHRGSGLKGIKIKSGCLLIKRSTPDFLTPTVIAEGDT